MRKIYFLLIMLAFLPTLTAAPRIGTSERSVNLIWDYTVRAGVTTQLAATIDTMSVLGASDTVVTRYYANLGGDVSLQIYATGGTTKRYKVVIETFDKGTETVDDLLFTPKFYVHWSGYGDANCYVTSAEDSILTTGKSSSLFLPLLGVYGWRVKIISKSTQVGNTKFKITATVWKE